MDHAPAKHVRCEGPAKAVDRIQCVSVEHRRCQIGRKAAAPGQVAQALPQSAQCLRRRAAARGGGFAHPQEKGDHEDDIPDRREGADGARPFPGARIQPEDRGYAAQSLAACRILREQKQHQEKRQHAARVAEGKARAGDASKFLADREMRHQGVGEDRRELHRDETKPEEDDGPEDPAIGPRPPKRKRTQHIDRGKTADPAHAVATAIGDRAKDGRQQRNAKSCDCQPARPVGLCLRRGGLWRGSGGGEMRPGDLGEIGGEDEGQKQCAVGLACPVEEEPAPDAFACRNGHACRAPCAFSRSSPKSHGGARRLNAPAARGAGRRRRSRP